MTDGDDPGRLRMNTSPVLWRRSRSRAPDQLLRGAYALLLNTVLTSLLGVGYWVVAARSYSVVSFGRNAALISTMMLVSSVAQLGLTGALTRYLPRAGSATARSVRRTYAVSSATALLVGGAFVLLAPRALGQLAFLRDSPPLLLGLWTAVVLWTVFSLQDSVLVALRSAAWVPVENAAFGVAKIALLVAFASLLPTAGMFTSWTVAVALTLIPVNLLIFRRLVPRHAVSSAENAALPQRGELVRFVVLDYVGTLCFLGCIHALPLLVLVRLGPSTSAAFYVAWTVSLALDLVAANVGLSLTVEASHDAAALAGLGARATRRVMGILVPVVGGVLLGAPLLLRVFGQDYPAESSGVLRLLVLGSLPKACVVTYISLARSRGQVGVIWRLQMATAVLVLGGSLLLMAPLGVLGVGIAWLTAQAAVACWVFPRLWRMLRGAPPITPSTRPVAQQAAGATAL